MYDNSALPLTAPSPTPPRTRTNTMPSISDRKLASLYATFEAQKRTNPNMKLGTDQALQILAEVGDRSGWSSASALNELKKPGMTRDQQIEFAKKGLSASEK